MSKFETAGTVFDWLVHLTNAYMIAVNLSTVEVILGLVLVHVFVKLLLYSPRYVYIHKNWREGGVKVGGLLSSSSI